MDIGADRCMCEKHMYESTPPSPYVGVLVQNMVLVALAVALVAAAAAAAAAAAFVFPSSYEHVRGRWRPSMCAGGGGVAFF